MSCLSPEYYERIVSKLEGLYPDSSRIPAVLDLAGIPGSFGNSGWDAALAFAEQEGLVKQLLENAFSDYLRDDEVNAIVNALSEGSAFLPELDYLAFLSPARRRGPIRAVSVCAAADQKDFSGLLGHLRIYRLNGTVETDELLVSAWPGDNAQKDDLLKMGRSCVVLLALSPDFFMSEQCLQLTYTAYRMKKRVVPVLLRESAYHRIDFLKNIQPLPRDRSFIVSSHNKNKTEMEVAIEIEALCSKLKKDKLCR